jgi:hypothetical protein
LNTQEKSRRGASKVWLPATLAAVCLSIAVMASVSNRAIAAAETPSADTSAASCPHQINEHEYQWKPSDSDLRLILARHRGYVFIAVPELPEPAIPLKEALQMADDESLQDSYLDHLIDSGAARPFAEARLNRDADAADRAVCGAFVLGETKIPGMAA